MSECAKTAILFSGQGSQVPGMAVWVTDKYPQLSYVWDTAKEVLSFDLYEMCKSGTAEELAVTKVAQPAIMAASILSCEALKLEGKEFSAVAGHSLGEYAAMVECGVLSLEDGFKVIKARSEAMQSCVEASQGNAGVMYAILNKSNEEIEKVCEETEGYVVPVNYNSLAQTVIAGEDDACTKAAETLAGMGARTVKLGVAAAFHSKLMQKAADDFTASLNALIEGGVKFNAPSIKMMSNITGKELDGIDNIVEKLAAHIVSPVRFTDELLALESMGYDTYIECGPGKVLTGCLRKTLKGVAFGSTDDLGSFEKAITL